MPTAVRTIAAALVIGLAFGGVLLLQQSSPAQVGWPTPVPPSASPAFPTPSTAPSPSQASALPGLGRLTERVTDDDGSISIAHPAGWTELLRPAGNHSVGVDLDGPVSDGVKAVRLIGQWVPLAAGQSAADWIAEQDVTHDGELSCAPPANDAIAIGGHPGLIIDGGCGILGGRTHYRAVAVVGERGYTFHMDSTILSEDGFRTLLANVIIDPTAGS